MANSPARRTSTRKSGAPNPFDTQEPTDATVTELSAPVAETPVEETPVAATEETPVTAPEETPVTATEDAPVETTEETPVEATEEAGGTDWDALLGAATFEDKQIRDKRPTVEVSDAVVNLVRDAYTRQKRGTIEVTGPEQYAEFKVRLQSAGDKIDKSVHVTEHKDKKTGKLLAARFTVGERRGKAKKK